MRTTLAIIAIFISALLGAQAPALIPYQAIARNAAGEPLASSTLNARFTIHDLTATGTSVWQELQTVSTSPLGLFTVQLGSSVALSGVNWASGAKFMQVEIDLGIGFVDIGTQQLLSVPYSLHSASAASALSAGDGISNVSLTGDTLFLNNGNFLIIPGLSEVNNSNGNYSNPHTCGAANVHNSNLAYGQMADQEGNLYKTVLIGTQEWMAENLNTSIYRNGDLIPSNLDNSSWQNTTIGACEYFNSSPSYACPYGKLYNWYACADARQLCPLGWHVPTREEWLELKYNLSDSGYSGAAMKSKGRIEGSTGLWYSPNAEASNSSGFSGLPGGSRHSNGGYNGLGLYGYWWSAYEESSDYAVFGYLYYGDGDFNTFGYDKNYGFSVRCLRD